MYERWGKRLLDSLVSIATLGLGAPVLVLISFAIKRGSAGSVFYSQERVGKDAKKFEVYKFRSMLRIEDSCRPDGSMLANEDRVTRVGRFLRTSGLDEIPQLFNVLRGEMSIVGPRPTLPYQVERYDEEQLGRLAVKPGLTGLAQVNGRNELSWDEKIAYDLTYARSVTLRSDLMIMLRTLGVVLGGKGVKVEKLDSYSTHNHGYWKDI